LTQKQCWDKESNNQKRYFAQRHIEHDESGSVIMNLVSFGIAKCFGGLFVSALGLLSGPFSSNGRGRALLIFLFLGLKRFGIFERQAPRRL
jgi:hypothetical protein